MRHFAVPVLTLAASLLSISCSRQGPIQAKQDSAPVKVQVAPVVSRQMQRAVESVGTLYPFDETVVSAEIDGRVDQVNADLGDDVKQGQLLVHISDEEQRYLLAQTEAQLRMDMERLGMRSEKDRVADIRETSEVRRAQADLLEAQQRYGRLKSLVDQGIGARADLDQAQARLKSAQASYDQSVNQIRNLIQEVERSKAALELQRKKLRDTSVYAPFSGKVKERVVNPGAFVRTNTPLFTLVKTDPIRLRLEIPERMAPWIRTGQAVDVSVEAFTNRKFTGNIWRISPTVEQTKRTFVVEALLENHNGDLKPGSYARARVPTNKTEEIRLIPFQSVNYVLGSNKAYVVKSGVVDAREVKLGDRFDNQVEILEGLNQGELVAVTQVNRLDTGSRVEIVSGGKEARGRTTSD